MTRSSPAMRDVLVAAVGAGVVSGVTVAAYAALVQLLAGEPLGTTYIYLASELGGPSLGAGPGAVWIGVLVLFGATIPWAFGYIHAAQRQPQLFTHPIISGIFFGLVVWLIMQLVLVVTGRFVPWSVYSVYRDLIGCMFCFGPPLAYTAARLSRAP
ncbi:MAG TPA: hypothetical protein VGP41_03750 [Candidatus Lustribacter sp.]|nr:hypothetical protein [Candidatus Lustribacter sp.]